MADDNHDTPAADTKPTPRRRPPRKTAAKTEAAAKPTAAKRASRPAASPPKKPATPRRAAQSSTPSRTDRARRTLDKAADKVGGKRNAGLIAGGLAVAGAAAAALLSLRGSTPKRAANDTGTKAHQPDGTDSSAQMDAMIADESMIPDITPRS